MPSRIICEEGHTTRGISLREAAIAIAEGRALGSCKKCGKPFQFMFEHAIPGDPKGKERSFRVTRAVRFGLRPVGGIKQDAFLLVLRDDATGRELVLPTAWAPLETAPAKASAKIATGAAKSEKTAAKGTHTTLILGLEEWRRLFRQLDAAFEGPLEKIRQRAYELYEQRGRLDGHDMEDWLQAEAEITGVGIHLAAA
jgi:hypothetical protein